jgi:hypothetical protein
MIRHTLMPSRWVFALFTFLLGFAGGFNFQVHH